MSGAVTGAAVNEGEAVSRGARKRRRWWPRIAAIVVVIGLLLGAAEFALRLIVPNVIAGAVREQLDLSADHPVDVELGGSALWHTITGRVGQVTVRVDDAQLVEGLRGDMELQAEAVPFDFANGDIEDAKVRLTVDRDQLPAAVSLLTAGIADSGEVQGGQLVVGRTAQIFGIDVTISVSLGLSVEGGDVVVDPKALSAAGFDLTAEQLSSLLDITAQTVCVRDRLPIGVTLTDIALSSTGSVTIGAELAPGIVSDAAQREPGTCG